MYKGDEECSVLFFFLPFDFAFLLFKYYDIFSLFC